ncbi:MAG: hypothetical protein ACREAB_10455, partial [Blastocatellia bacterium]
MRGLLKNIPLRATLETIALALLGFTGIFALHGARADAMRGKAAQDSTIQLAIGASFADKQSIAPDELIELTANRPLAQGEGRLAVVVGATDLTDLFIVSAQSLKYGAGKSFPLPMGETELTVYLVAPNDDWRDLARFPLRVGANAEAKTENAEAKPEDPEAKTETQPATDASAQQEPTLE